MLEEPSWRVFSEDVGVPACLEVVISMPLLW
jgi:hypothetical protein